LFQCAASDVVSNFTTQEDLQQGTNSVTIPDNCDDEKNGIYTSEEFHGPERYGILFKHALATHCMLSDPNITCLD